MEQEDEDDDEAEADQPERDDKDDDDDDDAPGAGSASDKKKARPKKRSDASKSTTKGKSKKTQKEATYRVSKKVDTHLVERESCATSAVIQSAYFTVENAICYHAWLAVNQSIDVNVEYRA